MVIVIINIHINITVGIVVVVIISHLIFSPTTEIFGSVG